MRWKVALVWVTLSGAAWAQSAPLPAGTSVDELPPKVTLPQGRTAVAAAGLAGAEAKIDSKDYSGARSLLEAYLAAHPTDARALFDRGYVEDAEERPDAAAGYYRKAIAANPQQFEARLALGLDLAASGKAEEAREQLEAATRLTPEPPNPAAQAQADRALARLLRNSDPDAARAALLAGLKLSPETPADTLLTAEIAEAEGDAAVASEAYHRVLTAEPDDADATAGLAHLLIQQKNYAEAEPLLRKALAKNPQDPALNAQLAAILSAQGKQDEAVAAVEKLHASAPDDLHITAMLADLYAQGGDAAKADPLYIKLLAAAPHDASLLAARGNNLIRQGRYADAVPVLEQSTQLDGQNADAWSGLAFAASETHQPQLTLDALAMRSKVTIDTPSTYFLSATAYDTLHQVKRAVEMYRKFLAAAGGKFPDQEWQAKHRLVALRK